MKTNRKPYQVPELILLGKSANDTSNPHEKAHGAIETTAPVTSIFAVNDWIHFGPQGQAGDTFAHPHTQHIS